MEVTTTIPTTATPEPLGQVALLLAISRVTTLTRTWPKALVHLTYINNPVESSVKAVRTA